MGIEIRTVDLTCVRIPLLYAINSATQCSPKKFYDVASVAHEDEYLLSQGLLLQRALHLSTQPIETTAHVRRPRDNPNPGYPSEVRSPRKSLDDRCSQCRLNAWLDTDQCSSRELDVDRATVNLDRFFHHLLYHGICHDHR